MSEKFELKEINKKILVYRKTVETTIIEEWYDYSDDNDIKKIYIPYKIDSENNKSYSEFVDDEMNELLDLLNINYTDIKDNIGKDNTKGILTDIFKEKIDPVKRVYETRRSKYI